MELSALFNNGPIVEALSRAHSAQPLNFVYERASLFCTGGIGFAKIIGIPHVLELNAPLIGEQEKYRSLQLKDAAVEIELELLQNTSVVCAVSEPLAGYARSKGATNDKIHVIGNGVDGAMFHKSVDGASVRRSLTLPEDAFIVGFVGGLRPWHGLQLLADAIAAARKENPRIYLVVVGDGPQKAAFQERAEALGILAFVKMCGAVAHEYVPQWIAACDVLTAPYESGVEDYFCPLKVAEALAVGRPVIASDLPAIRSILQDSRSGVITDPGDIVQFSSAILQLASDPARVRTMGANAAELGSEYYWDAITRRVIGLVENARARELA